MGKPVRRKTLISRFFEVCETSERLQIEIPRYVDFRRAESSKKQIFEMLESLLFIPNMRILPGYIPQPYDVKKLEEFNHSSILLYNPGDLFRNVLTASKNL